MSSFTNFFTNLFAEEPPAQPRKTQGKQKVPVQTKREAVQEVARKATGRSGNAVRAFGSGINQWLPFEVVNRAVAALAPGNYLENLNTMRANQAADAEAHPWAYGIGALGGALGGGGALSKGIQGTGTLIAKAPGIVGKTGKALAASQTLRAGEKAKNLAKLSGSGAVLAGAEEAVRGGDSGDVATAATVGAVAAPIAGKLVDAGGYLFRPAIDLLRRTDASGRVLRRLTSATTDDMQAARTAYKAANNGAEPTLFELLPPGDVPRIRGLIDRMNPGSQQRAAQAIQARARNVQPEMNANIDAATQNARRQVEQRFAGDLAQSRGGQALPTDLPVASEAATSQVGVERLRSAEARNIMAPHDNTVVAQSVDEFLPSWGVQGSGVADPETARVLRNAAGSLRLTEEGINVSDVTRIVDKLKSRVRANGTDADAAQAAINHIDDFMQANNPEAAAAIAQMNAQFAGKSRVGEGITEGMASRPAAEAAQRLNQYEYGKVYDTPEGAQGRMIGQTAALRQQLSGTPEDAMRAVSDLADNTSVQQAVSQNISPRAALQLQQAADVQAEGLRRLASLDKNLKDSIPESELSVLGNALLTFNPASFPLTRLSAAMRVIRHLKLPDRVDRLLVDSLFSQDARQINAAINRLNSAGRDGRRALIELAGALPTASVAGTYAADPQSYEPDRTSAPETPAPVEDFSNMSDEELQRMYQEQSQQAPVEDFPNMSDEELQRMYQEQSAQPYGQSIIQSVFPEAEVTDAVRDPNSALGRENPNSYHVRTNGAVDVRPIPGLTFEEFVQRLKDEGYQVVEAIDEVKNPSSHATGPHWHVAFA